MTQLRSMPRPTIALAGFVIAGCALAGFALGAMNKLKGAGGPDSDTGEVVAPIKTVANATPLTSPPVTEADVRRWVHEELATSRPAPAPVARKPKADNGVDADSGDGAASPTASTSPAQPAAPGSATPKNQTAQQIPF